ncbi:MAG: Radical domain protein [Caulobacteraceae bacterium]|nr:Radical domain protein [Caulobacteraceae bacterium]
MRAFLRETKYRVLQRVAFNPLREPPRAQQKKREPSATRSYHDQGGVIHHPEPDVGASGQAGIFFRYPLSHIPAGSHVVRYAILFPEQDVGGQLTLECLLDGEVVGAHVFDIDEPLRRIADTIDLPVELAHSGVVEFRGHVTRGLRQTHLRYIDVHDTAAGLPIDYVFPSDYNAWPVRRLRNIVIGTTGVCNASCPHCPTNKPMLAHLARAPMPWPLFKRLVDQIAAARLYIEGNFTFGLHGDALMDPMVVERARYLKSVMPHAKILLNTNAGPFNERRHAPLIDLVDFFGVHAEALSSEVYAQLMQPLRADVVFPKIERLIELAGDKVAIVSPISQVNIGEYAAMSKYWNERGVQVIGLPFTNRVTDNLNYYDYALAPSAGICRQEVVHDLVIDWDGKVLACCQDFSRSNAIGDLEQESVQQVLSNAARRKVFDLLGEGRWSEFSSCRNCKFDHATRVEELLEEALHKTTDEASELSLSA